MAWDIYFYDSVFEFPSRGRSGTRLPENPTRPSKIFDYPNVPEPDNSISGITRAYPKPESATRGYPNLIISHQVLIFSNFIWLT